MKMTTKKKTEKITRRTTGARGCYFLTSVSWKFLGVSMKHLEDLLLPYTVASFLECAGISWSFLEFLIWIFRCPVLKINSEGLGKRKKHCVKGFFYRRHVNMWCNSIVHLFHFMYWKTILECMKKMRHIL